ncbi:MAG: cscK, partial [Thermomicrobiales bacterium]|nr:cscK [Thermomicrobiales bacterium]
MSAGEQSNSGQILAIGEILVDFIVTDGATSLEAAESFVARSGGAPANAAVALARLGLASAFCGVVGDDQFGARLQAELAAEGVDTSRLRQSHEA